MHTVEFKFDFGDKVEDVINGYAGIVIAVDEWQTGCKRACVKSQSLKDGLPLDSQWIDEANLSLVEAAPVTAAEQEDGLGGPHGDNPQPHAR